MTKLEKEIERKLRLMVVKHGGLCLKWVCPGWSGVPDRIVLMPKEFTGGCVKVTAAGKTTVLGWDPYEADVTEAYRQGAPISVTVYGTRTNVFGPLHEVAKPAGVCGPGSFVTGGDQWTDNYSLLRSGVRGFTFKAQQKD